MTVQKWSLKEIVDYAKSHSPFYRDLYQNITFEKLSDLPIVDQVKFWKDEVVTNSKPDGIVFKSGGSTGAPKYSYFTSLEWQSFTEAFGWGMSQNILEDYDRVANLFYVGDLYASFLFIKDSVQWIPVENRKLLQFPVSGSTDPNVILKTLEEFSINVLLGVPSAVLTVLEYYDKNREKFPGVNIEKLLFGGESLYLDQRSAILKIFPEIKISSIGYASVDAGLLGYSDKSCRDGEHRVFDRANIIEIVDVDTNEVISETGRVGKVLVTNLTRKLMPIIRYPAGDLAIWVESAETPYRKFKLLGRSDEAARLGTISVFFEDTRAMVMKALGETDGLQFQMILNHFNHKDELVLKMSGHGLKADSKLSDKIIEAFIKEKVAYSDVLSKNLIHPLKIEIVDMRFMEVNLRTGKLKRVVDNRIK